MATDTRHDKKVTIDLDVPLTNVGNFKEGKYNHRNNTTLFHGRMEVDEALADDLLRRQKEYQAYERTLHKDNGVKDVDGGEISGNQA